MNDQTSIFVSAVAGAVVGGCFGYLFLTDEGRRLRADLEPKLMDLVGELDKARTMVKDAKKVIGDVRPFGR
ncbi:MAG: YtxH domain-containing protein [Vicinamibacterales bacterium]